MEPLLAHCAAAFSQHGSLFAVFFLGGLAGSLTHCLTMCGPVVASQAACQSSCGGAKGACGARAGAASQWQYHLGRLLTYGAFGFFAALLSKQLASAAYWPVLASAMMLLAGGLFLASALFPGRHALLSFSVRNGFLRGALMSFMPCGLLYAALMMAATLANPLAGMVAMWLFVLGTMPVLLLASSAAEMLTRKWREWVSGIGRLAMACNGLALFALAVRTLK